MSNEYVDSWYDIPFKEDGYTWTIGDQEIQYEAWSENLHIINLLEGNRIIETIEPMNILNLKKCFYLLDQGYSFNFVKEKVHGTVHK